MSGFPPWLLAKRRYFLHLSNSLFTKRLMKELYDIDSAVLYPPVQLPRCSRWDLKRHRKFSLIIVRPKAISGIMFLPNVVSGLAKETPLIVIGECDVIGLSVIKYLKKKGFNVKYFGFVAKSFKEELFKRASHYLHLGFNESFGITVIETMASGCIPIAPRSGAIPEYLPDNLLYSDFEDAAEKLETKLGIDDLKLKMDLRRTAEKFDEHNFREKFCRCVGEVAKTL